MRWVMRWLICALVVLGFAPRALAGDLDILRGEQPVGPATFTRWSGFYIGGQVGYSNANADFSNATQGPLGFLLRQTALEADFSPSQWQVLGRTVAAARSYGGFAGFNTQWQDLMLGIEADYTRASAFLTAPASPISRFLTTNPSANEALGFDPTLNGSATLQLVDYASLRARAGWIFGNFLPYGFAGLVIGRANYTVSASAQWQEATTVSLSGQPPPPVFPCDPSYELCSSVFSVSSSDSKNSALMYGFSVGGGLDFALTSNIFVRGEFEFVQFAPLAGILASISSARVGAGLKF